MLLIFMLFKVHRNFYFTSYRYIETFCNRYVSYSVWCTKAQEINLFSYICFINCSVLKNYNLYSMLVKFVNDSWWEFRRCVDSCRHPYYPQFNYNGRFATVGIMFVVMLTHCRVNIFSVVLSMGLHLLILTCHFCLLQCLLCTVALYMLFYFLLFDGYIIPWVHNRTLWSFNFTVSCYLLLHALTHVTWCVSVVPNLYVKSEEITFFCWTLQNMTKNHLHK